jgi:Fe-S-cluster containining protein
MKLDVLDNSGSDQPWYADGLKFTCSQCGNCCTGAPGYVWISDVEIGRLAAHLRMRRADVLEKYCRRIGERYSLKERRSPQGLYDCVFLNEVKAPAPSRKVTHTRRVCAIYEVRPLQCRTWPFWDGLLADEERWKAAGERCHGINAGSRKFTLEQIEQMRAAADWPENPPTSSSGKK